VNFISGEQKKSGCTISTGLTTAYTTNREAIAHLMSEFRGGDRNAAGRLVELLYPELRRLAVAKMGAEGAGHTWQPTALVNELYLELLKVRALPGADTDDDSSRADFLAFAGHLMKRLLIHHARPLARRAKKVEIDHVLDRMDAAAAGQNAMVEIDSIMDRLEKVNSQIRLVVELKVFAGFTGAEIGARLGCGTATVARYWAFAQQWLKRELESG
jgi:RNA polymerase sigma factor (TIGR02999 family)